MKIINPEIILEVVGKGVIRKVKGIKNFNLFEVNAHEHGW